MADQEKKGIVKELKEFIFRGNVMDMAVGVVIGAAFSAIITSLVSDIFMPLLSLLTGKMDFTNMFVAMDGGEYATLAQAQEAGVATINYGLFITQIINFLLIAICIFFGIKGVNRLMSINKKPEEAEPEKEPRLCPFCKQEVADDATRCPHCTSVLPAPEQTEESAE